MKIEALAASHGDALLVRWADPSGRERVGLVDGGPAARYGLELQGHLAALAAETGAPQPTLEFVCVSHIDDDHIGGIERLFTTIRRYIRDDRALPATVKRLWFNSWDHLGVPEPVVGHATADPVAGASVKQGRDLREIARLLHLDGNAPFGTAILAGTGVDLDGLRVDVVAPLRAQLDALFAAWREKEPDLPAFTAAYRDRKVPNLSSIALLLRAGGRSALLTGDARGDHLLEGLDAGGFLTGGSMHVDVLKLPHHGSINNVAADLFEAVSADVYIVSADGVTHGLPDEECLELLVHSRQAGDEYTIVLTNTMPAIETFLSSRRQGRAFDVVVRDPAAHGVSV